MTTFIVVAISIGINLYLARCTRFPRQNQNLNSILLFHQANRLLKLGNAYFVTKISSLPFLLIKTMDDHM